MNSVTEIQAVSQSDIDSLLDRVTLAKLACAHEGQPYIAYLHLVASEGYLYGFTTLGRKISWMRDNPNVCVAFEEIRNSWDWFTVIITGRYEELPKSGQTSELRQKAYDLLSRRRAVWWEPATLKSPNGHEASELVYFRIHMMERNGRRIAPDSAARKEPSKLSRWLRGRLGLQD